MAILFIIVYILSNELTYMVAVHQQMGLCQHISAGNLCWINRIILIVPCIWYCGWIVGIILFFFSLFGLLHATIGWILSMPSLFSKSEDFTFKLTEFECGVLPWANIICAIFTVLSFFLSTYKSVFYTFYSLSAIITLAIILASGFIIRLVVARFF